MIEAERWSLRKPHSRHPRRLRGPLEPKVRSLFMFCPLAVIRASQFTISSILNLILSMSCHYLSSPNSGSIPTFLFLIAFLYASSS